ncbi:hypothetical protein HH214_08780 [Mucilaginibacter robiniae]|uniref:Type IV toxin-antitoxin system AbiEi family antitoxin domain-containing protein n=1 Tax=Mucilaginibacter robiniae TaxID=2728022 RepID=A0A7L5E552_9SPHI|nr:hypothetical protein [Mucilaginibacter robiniae]QJD95963.1 hypothetical protein HH214_08780 [Mucilaginibacter robiniae]
MKRPDQLLSAYSGQLLTHQLLKNILQEYKRPNDKIKALKDEGILQAVKRGFYIPGPATRLTRPENGLIANHLYGPSYLSAETALSYYGLIPERVYAVTSMTSKGSREFDTPAGLFLYTHLPLPYYAYGLNSVNLSRDQRAIVASPEKALADKVVTTPGVLIRSVAGALSYLTEDLRMDESQLKNLNSRMMSTWLEQAPKRDSLRMIIKTLEQL